MNVERLHYGVTHQVEMADGTNMWVKHEAEATITQYEDIEIASKQLARQVHDALEKRVMEAVEHASRIGAE